MVYQSGALKFIITFGDDTVYRFGNAYTPYIVIKFSMKLENKYYSIYDSIQCKSLF